jgi:hypothetical protein
MFINLASPALFKRAVFFSQMDVTLKKIVKSWTAPPLGTLKLDAVKQHWGGRGQECPLSVN